MVAVNSTMLPLGTPLPPLELPGPTGAVWSAARDAAGAPALVVAFVCNHCPYVRHLRDASGLLAYRGRFDGSTPGNDVPVTADELDAAVRAVLAGDPVPAETQVASIGCNIKWRPGHEPPWFG